MRPSAEELQIAELWSLLNFVDGTTFDSAARFNAKFGDVNTVSVFRWAAQSARAPLATPTLSPIEAAASNCFPGAPVT